MNFQADNIDGMPLRDLRDFLRRNENHFHPKISIEHVAKCEWRRSAQLSRNENWREQRAAHFEKTRDVLRILNDNGFIAINDENQYFTITDLGRRLKASSLRRYTREAAKRQLDKFCARCTDINRREPDVHDPLSLCHIEATVFGSYARGEQEVGDCDIFVSVRIKDGAQDAWMAHIEATSDLPIDIAMRKDPHTLALRHIKKGLNIISMTNKLPDEIPDDEKIELDLS